MAVQLSKTFKCIIVLLLFFKGVEMYRKVFVTATLKVTSISFVLQEYRDAIYCIFLNKESVINAGRAGCAAAA